MAGMYPYSNQNPNPSLIRCGVCGGDEMEDGDDGFFYCRLCGSRVEDLMDTGVADEDFVDKTGGLSHGGTALYLASHRRKVHSTPTPTPFSLLVKSEDPTDAAPVDAVGPTEPADFGSRCKGAVVREEDYVKVIRRRYVVGLQTMVQLQCETLVQKFKVNPLICGIAASIWLRFVASTRVYDDSWADQAVVESESQGEKRVEGRKRYYDEPRNIYNERMVIVWYKSLKKRIPLSCSLAVSYLACHVAREPILPTDIVRWIIEGRLPYFGAFTEIERLMEKLDRSIRNIEIAVQMPDRPIMNMTVSIDKPSIACPLSASYMFRPSQAVGLKKLESMAASIAESVGLSLPPVNFYAIASRYLKQLGLPVGKILPYACRIYEWSMPPELWLSTNELKLPTRVCVMSVLIVAIRILYNINGFGIWEKSLSASNESSSTDNHGAISDPTHESNAEDAVKEALNANDVEAELEEDLASVHKFESDCTELLHNLEKRYNEMSDRHEHSKDLPRYLQYCREVVFAGSCEGDEKEAALIEKLWDFYQKNREDVETSLKLESGPSQKRAKVGNEIIDTPMEDNKHVEEETISFATADGRSLSRDANPEQPQTGGDVLQNSPASQTPTAGDHGEASNENIGDIAIRHLKIDMEERRFCYMPPRKNVKRHDYLLYVRKRLDGSLDYAAHADYYIILRACAKAAQVDVRVMHQGVLSLERRLAWIEKKIDHCLREICLNDSDTSDCNAAGESVN